MNDAIDDDAEEVEFGKIILTGVKGRLFERFFMDLVDSFNSLKDVGNSTSITEIDNELLARKLHDANETATEPRSLSTQEKLEAVRGEAEQMLAAPTQRLRGLFESKWLYPRPRGSAEEAKTRLRRWFRRHGIHDIPRIVLNEDGVTGVLVLDREAPSQTRGVNDID